MSITAFHPAIEALDKVVLVLSNKQDEARQFIEVANGNPELDISADVSPKRLDIEWFSQAWFAEEGFTPAKLTTDGTPYTLRNIRSGTYLQAGLPVGGKAELRMASLAEGKQLKRQTWYFTSENGFARIKNAATNLVVQLVEPQDGAPARLILTENDPKNTETQTWKYERVSRSAQDVTAALKATSHMPDKAIEYQGTDACYLNLPPIVRNQIWKSTGLGSQNLVWRNQIFDCDDFAFAAKAAVSRWTAENLKGQGFTVLFGITFGQNDTDGKIKRHAYNWYLDWNQLKDVVFFEPMNGTQSDDGWGYKGFNGLF